MICREDINLALECINQCVRDRQLPSMAVGFADFLFYLYILQVVFISLILNMLCTVTSTVTLHAIFVSMLVSILFNKYYTVWLLSLKEDERDS